ncbi:unnamed protein product [Nippostrongylus brasiliensis]|uniref:Titin n=1 Tax=Nippostrongylus brasiliensis TaxID=27835 RepID=A0A0N4YS61_NIPBR|nr:unnamed protein product [Nippostrongylus brasiliensis]
MYHDYYDMESPLSSLIEQIRALSSNAELPLPERLSLGRYLELWSDKIKLEFQAIRRQLHTLFAVPPILIALGPLTPELWEDILDEPAYDTYGKPIQLKQEFLERRISEDLETVETQRDYISRYLHETTLMDNRRRNSFEAQTLDTLTTIVTVLQESTKSTDEAQKALSDQIESLKEYINSSTKDLNDTITSAVERVGRGEATLTSDASTQTKTISTKDAKVQATRKKVVEAMPTSDASTQTKAISTKDAKVQAAKRKMVEQGTQTGPRVRASRKTQTELTKTDEMSQTEVRTMDSSSQTRVDDNKRGPTPPYPVQEGVKRRKEADEEPMDCTDEQDQNPDDEILETEDEVEDEEIPPDDIFEWDYEVEEIEEHADPNSPDAPDSPATPPPAAVEVQREVVEDEHQRHRRQLIQELRNAIQEKTDLKCILQQFEEQPSCPERRFSRADIFLHRDYEINCCANLRPLNCHQDCPSNSLPVCWPLGGRKADEELVILNGMSNELNQKNGEHYPCTAILIYSGCLQRCRYPSGAAIPVHLSSDGHMGW